MPDAVKASDNGGFRRHESVAHPDCEDSVLLPEGLTGGDFADVAVGDPSLALRMTRPRAARTVAAADIASEGELDGTAG